MRISDWSSDVCSSDLLSRAANGDLDEDIPAEIARTLPELAVAMDGLFRQLGENLESAQRLAMFDPVTALPNRINFRRSCERALAGLAPGSVAALLFIVLDRFKAGNHDRKSVVSGKSVSVRVYAGGLRILKNNNSHHT